MSWHGHSSVIYVFHFCYKSSLVSTIRSISIMLEFVNPLPANHFPTFWQQAWIPHLKLLQHFHFFLHGFYPLELVSNFLAQMQLKLTRRCGRVGFHLYKLCILLGSLILAKNVWIIWAYSSPPWSLRWCCQLRGSFSPLHCLSLLCIYKTTAVGFLRCSRDLRCHPGNNLLLHWTLGSEVACLLASQLDT